MSEMDRRIENLERESGWQREQIRSIKDDLGVIKTMLVQARWFVTGCVFFYAAQSAGFFNALTGMAQ